MVIITAEVLRVNLNMLKFSADTVMPFPEDDAREGTPGTVDLLHHGSNHTEQSKGFQ